MTALRRGMLLGVIQVAVVLSLGGKLLYDRMTRPHVWVLSEAYDPELPIRGRYLSQRLRFKAEGFTYKAPDPRVWNEWYVNRHWGCLQVRDDELVASPQGCGPGEWIHLHKATDGTIVALSEDPALLFIPEYAQIPSLKSGQELWVEVTVPTKGPPRPIQIGIKKDGKLTPLHFK